MNFKEHLLDTLKNDLITETDSSDIDYTPTRKSKDSAFKRELKGQDDINEYDESDENDEVSNISRSELIDILNNCDIDEKHLLLDIINQCSVISAASTYNTIDEFISAIEDALIGDNAFYAYSDLILSTLQEIDDYYEEYEQYGADPIDEAFYLIEQMGLTELGLNETVIDISHTKQLRRNRRKSNWKRQAILRARFRKTGEGKRQKKKAMRYLKKYRRQHKSKLKRYSVAYQKRWGGNTSK